MYLFHSGTSFILVHHSLRHIIRSSTSIIKPDHSFTHISYSVTWLRRHLSLLCKISHRHPPTPNKHKECKNGTTITASSDVITARDGGAACKLNAGKFLEIKIVNEQRYNTGLYVILSFCVSSSYFLYVFLSFVRSFFICVRLSRILLFDFSVSVYLSFLLSYAFLYLCLFRSFNAALLFFMPVFLSLFLTLLPVCFYDFLPSFSPFFFTFFLLCFISFLSFFVPPSIPPSLTSFKYRKF